MIPVLETIVVLAIVLAVIVAVVLVVTVTVVVILGNIKDGVIRVSYTRVGIVIVATIYLQLIQNRYMFRSFTVLHCSHQHCVQPVASDVEVVGYL